MKVSAGSGQAVLSPFLVAIVGGSGSGKTWLAEKLCAALAPHATRVSQDDFYADQTHLSFAQRATVNFDHPRALDWGLLERVVSELRAGRPVLAPRYSFKTHCRLRRGQKLEPAQFIILDGLWLLRRRSLRRLIEFSLFLDCPARTRWRRRLVRDLATRGRTRASICQQFWHMVEPMNERYVAPQASHANLVLRGSSSEPGVLRLARRIRALADPSKPTSSKSRRGL
jgi:uridine kinase